MKKISLLLLLASLLLLHSDAQIPQNYVKCSVEWQDIMRGVGALRTENNKIIYFTIENLTKNGIIYSLSDKKPVYVPKTKIRCNMIDKSYFLHQEGIQFRRDDYLELRF